MCMSIFKFSGVRNRSLIALNYEWELSMRPWSAAEKLGFISQFETGEQGWHMLVGLNEAHIQSQSGSAARIRLLQSKHDIPIRYRKNHTQRALSLESAREPTRRPWGAKLLLNSPRYRGKAVRDNLSTNEHDYVPTKLFTKIGDEPDLAHDS